MVVQELIARLGIEVDKSSVAAANSFLEGLGGNIAKLAGPAAIGAAATAFVGLVKATADAGDAVRKMAQRVGVDSIALQELSYAGDLADVSTESLAHALRFMAKSGVKDSMAELQKLANQFKSMPDGPEKTAIALARLGKSGNDLVPLLNGGSESLAELAAEAHDLGLVISKEDQKASEDFNDELRRLGKTFVGIRNQIFTGMIKPLTELITKTREFTAGFFKAIQSLEKFSQASSLVQTVIFALTAALVVLGTRAIWAGREMLFAWAKAGLGLLATAALIFLVGAALQELYLYLTDDGDTAIKAFVEYYKREFGSIKEFTSQLYAWIDDLTDGWVSRTTAKISAVFAPFKKVSRFLAGADASLPENQKDLVRAVAGTGAKFDAKGRLISGDVYTNQGQALGRFSGGDILRGPAAQYAAPQQMFSPTLNITTPIGAQPQDYVQAIVPQLDQWWSAKMNETDITTQK